MFEVGRIVMKTAGRDGGKKAVIINVLDDKYVMIDGGTRRKKCNIKHLEPLDKVIKVNKDASHEDVKKEFEKIGIGVRETKPKEKKEKPKKARGKKKVKEEVKKTEKKVKKGKKDKPKEKEKIAEKSD